MTKSLFSFLIIFTILFSPFNYAQDTNKTVFKTFLEQRAEYATASNNLNKLSEELNKELKNLRATYRFSGFANGVVLLMLMSVVSKNMIYMDTPNIGAEGLFIVLATVGVSLNTFMTIPELIERLTALDIKIKAQLKIMQEKIQSIDTYIVKYVEKTNQGLSAAAQDKRLGLANETKRLMEKYKTIQTNIVTLTSAIQDFEKIAKSDKYKGYIQIGLAATFIISAIIRSEDPTGIIDRITEHTMFWSGLGLVGYTGVYMTADTLGNSGELPVNELEAKRTEWETELLAIDAELNSLLSQL